MSTLSRHSADGTDGKSDLGLEVLGLAQTPPVAPLTRRELRDQERAALAPQGDAQAFSASPASSSSDIDALLASAPAPQGSAVDSAAPAKVPESLAPAAATVGVETLPVKLSKKAPKKPKTKKAVRMPRGVSRPQATTRPRGGAPRSRPKNFKRQLLSKLMTFGAMIGAGLMMVATSIPANAFYPVEVVTGTVAIAPTDVSADVVEETAADSPAAKVQSMSVRAADDQTFTRDNYTAVSLRERLFLKYGNRNWTFTNNPNGTIQWPFPIAVPISSGFGPRVAPCNGCSSFHEGVDFTPGGGTQIQAIADGVVSLVEEQTWGFGTHVVIDHHIDGNLVQSIYAHMQRGSAKVTLGQKVSVTDIVGLVGSTGASTGDHLHLEIHVNGVQVNPFDWLKANAN